MQGVFVPLVPIAQQLVDAFGGANKLAAHLGISSAAVYHWTRVPRRFVQQVHEATGIPLHELAPDLYKPEDGADD